MMLALVGLAASAGAQVASAPGLEDEVPVIEVAALAQRLRLERGPGGIALFDVRDPVDFAVSHLPSAVLVAYDSGREAFLAGWGPQVKGRTVVFYCTAGLRSHDFAQGLYHDLIERGAREVLELKAGIIGWHNAGLPLIDGRGPTRAVHPFNAEMRKLMKRPELARFAPAG